MQISLLCSITVPSSPPINIFATVYDSMQASVDWSLPPISEHNGVIIAYYVSLINPTTGNETAFITNSTDIILDDLEPYTTYQYAVAAYTSVGLGPLSSYYSFKTEEDGELSRF